MFRTDRRCDTVPGKRSPRDGGRVPGTVLSGTVLSIRYIDPGGEWDDDEDRYAMSDITRVDFGGAYEEALVLAGSEG